MEANSNQAPGAPGTLPKWTSSSKSGVGKALNGASDVTFTLSHGIVNEIYYPREDIACIRDMGFLVADGAAFFSEEKRDTSHQVDMILPGVPAYTLTNEQKDSKYQIIKEIIADPLRDTVLQKITFNDKSEQDLKLFILLAPHLNNQGSANTGWIGNYKGVPMLFAEGEGITMALACSTNFLKRSVGYVGVSDGWIDISQHKAMNWEYEHADAGNIALTGEIDLGSSTEFILALSFGKTQEEAAQQARASLLAGFETAKNLYVAEWSNWQNTLTKIPGKDFEISAMVLRMHEAKKYPGGIIASLSIPWGDYKGDGEQSGYHVVWPRDLVESSGGFRALDAKEDAARIVNYLMATQNEDGSWPQNMWLQGTPNWTGLQMDQIALPVLEVYQCFADGIIDKPKVFIYWPLIKKSLAFILANGPFTNQDRWEEEQGYTQFTMAAQIAGLLAGAELAAINDEQELAEFCRETADYWNASIEELTYIQHTEMANFYDVDGYYIRINTFHNTPANRLGDATINLKNHTGNEGDIKLTDLISIDALALVRFGLRAADDIKITNTLKVIDKILKLDTPYGPCWHRYSKDGYGEHDQGEPFDGSGIGRAWPLLTGERGHYEVAAGNYEEANKLISAMDGFMNFGLLPEQIWDQPDIPEKGLYFGKHSGSGMPLTWAHSEYLKLCASVANKKVIDMPLLTQDRYIKATNTVNFKIWSFDNPIQQISKGKFLRIQSKAPCLVVWSDYNWETDYNIETEDYGIGIYKADLHLKNKNASSFEFTFYWKNSDTWEGKNYSVKIIA